MAQGKTTIAHIQTIEEKLGVRFPEEYVAHLLAERTEVLGERGIPIEVKEEVR